MNGSLTLGKRLAVILLIAMDRSLALHRPDANNKQILQAR